MPFSDRPPVVRDCVECGAVEGMQLQNTARTQPINIPLLYTCVVCGCTLTVPPTHSPIGGPIRRNQN